MKAGHAHRLVSMVLPPCQIKISDDLALPISLLGLADPFGGILAAKRKQRITDPPTPLLETAQRSTRRKIRALSSPAPNGQRCGQQPIPVFGHVAANISRESPRLGVLGAGIELDRKKPACQ